MSNPSHCPICTSKYRSIESDENAWYLDCERCGRFAITQMAALDFEAMRDSDPFLPAILSHLIRRAQGERRPPRINRELLKSVRERSALPEPAAQVDNLLLWLADESKVLGQEFSFRYIEAAAQAGAVDEEAVDFIIRHLVDGELIEHYESSEDISVRLTLKGWERVHLLRRGATRGHAAFMAMAFGNTQLTTIFTDYFKPAVLEAGFDLIRLDEIRRAGLIDEKLRVEIRKSAFLVADLTDANLGAYWEAGFAEGLGKPVIYTCEKSVFDQKQTHFDTNHLHTVLWEPENPGEAANELKATIRATLPHLAKLED